MLYISLVLSLILLLLAYYSARQPTQPVTPFFPIGGLATVFVLSMLIASFLPAVVLHFFLLSVTLAIWRNYPHNRRLALPVVLVPTVVAYGITGWFAMKQQREFAQLREQFRYESLEERLPPPQQILRPNKLPDKTNEWLTSLEKRVDTENTKPWSRSQRLRELHEKKVQLFTNSPGFGVSRMVQLPSKENIDGRLRTEPPLPQPGSQEPPSGSSGEERSRPPRGEDEALYRMHQEGIVDFANIAGFGFVKDRGHVAGFQSHQFSEVPKPTDHWEIERLELIGLLLHDEPVAYVSEHLPRMDELREAPTRALDRFEAMALEELRRGKDLSVEEMPWGLRMLGAVRSVKQCVECHGGERGDLLGAFSYTLHRSTH
jgi:hypothetical protein